MSAVDQYISGFSVDIRVKLEELRVVIKNIIPEAEEVISYAMPAYKFKGMVVYFAAFKNHYSLFARPIVMTAFVNELKYFICTKSSVHFEFDKELPHLLVQKIVEEAVRLNLESAEMKALKKKK